MMSSTGNPFVGLRPFESDESLLFFGRQHQVLELLQRLHQHHFVTVTGSSGSGKSSLIKAGLIPRLKAGFLVDDRDRWIIASAKPGQSPICNLADSLLTQLDYTTHNISATDLQNTIITEGVDAILDLLKPLWKSNTNFFLLIDQFEELFRFSLNDDSTPEQKDEAIDFVNILLQLSAHTELPIYVVLTMRSDFIGDCSQFYGLPEAMNQSQYIVPRLNRVQLETTITGPVRLYDAKIETALTARLLNDAQGVKDELPLLQHALMRLWDHKENIDPGGELTIADYESIGGIEKALCNHADEALKNMSETDLALTKKIFQALTGIDENGRKIRRPVHLSELQSLTGANNETLLNIVNRFIEDNRSFLVINRSADNTDLLIDMSHESLIRQWGTLNKWVDEEAEAGKLFLRLTEAATLYNEGKKDLLSGNELQQFLQWYNASKPGKIWAQRYNASFENNLVYLKQSEKESIKQKAIKRRTRRLFITTLLLIIVLLSAFAIFIYRNNIKNKNELAINYWKNSQYAKAANNFLDGLHLLTEAAVITTDKTLVKNLMIDAEASLPHTILDTIFIQHDIVHSVAFSGDDKTILIAGNDGVVRLLEKASGTEMVPGMQHPAPVTTATFSTDSKWIVTACGNHTAYLWEAASGKQWRAFQHEDDVTCVGFSPDGKLILTGSADGYVRLWQIDSGTVIDSIQQAADINNAVFSPDGKKILISCNDASPYIWDVTIKKEVPFIKAQVENNLSVITNAIFNIDGTKILTTGTDSTLRVWDTTATLLAVFKHNDKITDAAFSPDGKWLLTASDDKKARLWNIDMEAQAGAAMKHDGPVYSVCFSHDGKQILTAGWDKIIKLWNVEPAQAEKKFIFKHHGIVTTALFNKEGTKILSAGYDSTAKLWDRKTRQAIHTFTHDGKINSAVFNNNGLKIVTAGDDSTVRTWDATTGKLIDVLKFNEKVHKAVYDANSRRLLTVDHNNNISLWNAAAQPMTIIDSFQFETEIADAVFSPDGKTLLIAGGDSAAHIVQASSGKELMSFKHGEMVASAIFNTSGSKILTASWDRTARLWNATTGQQIGSSMVHQADARSAAFSADEKWIVTTAFDKATHLWNTATLKEIGLGKNHKAALNGAVFSADNRWILTAGYDSTAELQEIEGDLDVPPALFMLQAKAITGVAYNIETSETQCIPLQEWLTLKRDYQKQADEHYKTCKFPGYNLWARFNKNIVADNTH